MKDQHRLVIHTLRDPDASCSCGRWHYSACSTGQDSEQTLRGQVESAHRFHTLIVKESHTKATSRQQLVFLARDVLPLLNAICAGYDYDPGDSDLDNEQPIHVRMTLGDYRRAVRLENELEGT